MSRPFQTVLSVGGMAFGLGPVPCLLALAAVVWGLLATRPRHDRAGRGRGDGGRAAAAAAAAAAEPQQGEGSAGKEGAAANGAPAAGDDEPCSDGMAPGNGRATDGVGAAEAAAASDSEEEQVAAPPPWAAKESTSVSPFASFGTVASMTAEEAAAFLLPPLIPGAAAVGAAPAASAAPAVAGPAQHSSSGGSVGMRGATKEAQADSERADAPSTSAQHQQHPELQPTAGNINATAVALLTGCLADSMPMAVGEDSGCYRPHHHLIPSSSICVAREVCLYLPEWTRLWPADAPPFLSPEQASPSCLSACLQLYRAWHAFMSSCCSNRNTRLPRTPAPPPQQQQLASLIDLLQGLARGMLAQAGIDAQPVFCLYWDDGGEGAGGV